MENVSINRKISLTESERKCILTVNQRLSVELKRQFSPIQQAAWLRTEVLPLTTWVKQQWLNHATHGVLLSPWQEYTLWHHIIANDDTVCILNITKTATLAQRAWSILQQWNTHIQKTDHDDNQDIITFTKWTEKFRSICQKNGFVCESELCQSLCQMIETRQIATLPSQIEIAGFDEFSPAITQLISTLQTRTTVKIMTQEQTQSPVHLFSFPTPDDELRSALNWALTTVSNSNDSIGIIVPDLTEKRHSLSRLLQNTSAELYNISAGQKLIEYDIIQMALTVIKLSNGYIRTKEAYCWLQSPYLTCNEHEIDIGSLLDKKLRSIEESTLPFSILFDLIKHIKNKENTLWIKRLRDFNDVINKIKKADTPHNISQSWCDCLNAMGWPGGRELTSLEHQLVEKCETLLTEFTMLSRVRPLMTQKEAIDLFEQQCKETYFQPEGSEAPLQILGLLESSGMHFNRIWITSLDDEALPPAIKPNPFIPISLQREKNMPHSSAERERLFSNQLLQRLLNSSEFVSISWSESKDNKCMQPSPLIANFTCFQGNNTETINSLNNVSYLPNNLEESNDNMAPEVVPEEHISGGSWLLELQANCPFRAFAEIRLHATPLASPSMGISPAQKGALIHRILEQIWNTLNSQHNLLKLDSHSLHDLIDKTVSSNLELWQKAQPYSQSHLWISLEKVRLNKLLTKWFEEEKRRDDFTVIAHEIEQNITVNKLNLKIKLDRIDQLVGGGNVIIDYKTGNASINNWFGERPSSPQLPLYCSYSQTPSTVDGMGYAFIKPQKTVFTGVCRDHLQSGIPGIVSIKQLKDASHLTWDQCIQHWKQSLAHLSNEFTSGLATVTPLSPSSCQYCQLHSFCRITK